LSRIKIRGVEKAPSEAKAADKGVGQSKEGEESTATGEMEA